ncbi:MAG: hypothetical protein B7Y86_10465 [Brevundimonas subvibrioides]|uniref:General secretion pathway protein GspM n=1 Tax=Brevundimonas subvibrioides TaxID=74313 RepID=A0A258HJ47_9CAUL|nr:hypothetical protein [Brevundimonas subvibrioides]OYX56358.1 MAG: hypothetical protein B7Y86_10465 [Brevundimonas subvibrioides]
MTIVETVTVRTRTYVATLGARFARTTPRERLLLGALVAGAVLYAPVAALEARDNAESAYADALSARDTARRARVQAVNASNQAAHQLALRDMSDWGFDGGNLDIVRVRIEQSLSAAATDAAMTGVAIETSEAAAATGPVTWVSAQIQGDLLWSPTFRLLDEISGWPEGFRVTRFAFEKSPPPAFEGAPPPLTPGRVTIGLDFPTRTATADGPAA